MLSLNDQRELMYSRTALVNLSYPEVELVCIDVVKRVTFLQFDGFLEVVNSIRRWDMIGIIIITMFEDVAIEGESGQHELP